MTIEEEVINKIKADFGEYCLLNPLDFEMDEISKEVIMIFFMFKELLKKYTIEKFEKEELDLKLFKDEKIFKMIFQKKVNNKKILINGIYIKEKNEFSIDFLKDYNSEKKPFSIKIETYQNENLLNAHIKKISENILEKIILKNFKKKHSSFTVSSKRIIEEDPPQNNNPQNPRRPRFDNPNQNPEIIRPGFIAPEIGRNDLLPPNLGNNPFNDPGYGGMQMGPNHPFFKKPIDDPNYRKPRHPDIDFPEENPKPYI